VRLKSPGEPGVKVSQGTVGRKYPEVQYTNALESKESSDRYGQMSQWTAVKMTYSINTGGRSRDPIDFAGGPLGPNDIFQIARTGGGLGGMAGDAQGDTRANGFILTQSGNAKGFEGRPPQSIVMIELIGFSVGFGLGAIGSIRIVGIGIGGSDSVVGGGNGLGFKFAIPRPRQEPTGPFPQIFPQDNPSTMDFHGRRQGLDGMFRKMFQIQCLKEGIELMRLNESIFFGAALRHGLDS
jgi:hypothetical protein